MTRINTNVSSLVAQKNLARTNNDLQTALTRLSTGLRINVGKDDPAGLIASEALRSDIVGVEKAILNSERANQIIATADSALGQVSQLLTDIRGLVSEAANSGALSSDQIAANQLQIDSSLEAIDRIAKITSFQGKRLLDGSLDFLSSGVNAAKIQDLNIDQANFGTLSAIGVSVQVVAQATRGQLTYAASATTTATVLELSGGRGSEAFSFGPGSSVQEMAAAINLVSDATGVEAIVNQPKITLSSFGANNDIVLSANGTGGDPGNVQIKYEAGGSSGTTATYTPASGGADGTLVVSLQTSEYKAAELTFSPNGSDSGIVIRSKVKGADFNGINVVIADGGTAGSETVAYDGSTRTLTITVDTTDGAESTAAQVVAAFSDAANLGIPDMFEASLVGGGTGAFITDDQFADLDAGAAGALSGGLTGGEIIANARDVVAAINASQTQLTAALAANNHGYQTVAAFTHYAHFGSVQDNNRLQFLGGASAPSIRFVAGGANQSLSVDSTTDPRVEGTAQYLVEGDDADTSFFIRATAQGADFDDYTISVVHNDELTGGGDEYSVLDKQNKTLTIYIAEGASTREDLLNAVNDNEYVSQYFAAESFGGGADTTVIAAASDLSSGKTSGGLASAGTLIVNLATDQNGQVTTTANDLVAFFDDPSKFISNPPTAASTLDYLKSLGISVANAGDSNGTGKLAATTEDLKFVTSGEDLQDAHASATTSAVNGVDARLTITAWQPGSAYDGVQIRFVDDGDLTGGGDEFGVYDAEAKTLTFHIVDGTTTAADIENIFKATSANYDADLAGLFVAALAGDGTGLVTEDDFATLSGGVVNNGSTNGAKLWGGDTPSSGGLTLRSLDYGSANFVQVKALSGSFELLNANGEVSERANGTDADLRINGVKAVTRGLRAEINTASLDLNFSLSASVLDGETMTFNITGGGALFQLGPDVVSNQQARLGIRSVSTATLGGVSGRLFELRSGGASSLTNNVNNAASIVEEVIGQVTNLRGRLGAFQKTTLESNIFTLNDTLANLKDAESSIRDADFAVESARLTRAQILVQSGTSVLSIANQNPQNVLALLR